MPVGGAPPLVSQEEEQRSAQSLLTCVSFLSFGGGSPPASHTHSSRSCRGRKVKPHNDRSRNTAPYQEAPSAQRPGPSARTTCMGVEPIHPLCELQHSGHAHATDISRPTKGLPAYQCPL